MKSILLLDNDISGHKYAFAKLFSKYLLKLGFKVILVLPEKTENIKEELCNEELINNLLTVNLTIRKINPIRIHKRINQVVATFILWLETKKIIQQAEKITQQKVDFVFFNWLDNYVINYLPYKLIDIFFPYRWSGLYFHPWYLFNIDYERVSISSQDYVLKSKNCIGVGVHDEILRKKLQNRIKKRVLYFPEIADASPPLDNYEIAEKLKNKALGKPIIGLIGLSKRKGLLHLIDVFNIDIKQNFFYFFAGPVPAHDYTHEEQEKINNFFSTNYINKLYFEESIPEGPSINSLVVTFDLIYLVYNNFKSSSNFLTKAVIFQKLSVGCDSYWIGENIKKFSLGIAVTGNSPKETLEAMELIVNKKHQLYPQWHEYLQINDEEVLFSTFKELLKHEI